MQNNHYENSDIDRLYSAVWGNGIHFGTYSTGGESIEDAAYATRDRMIGIADAGDARLILEVGSGHGVSARHLAEKTDGRIVVTNYAANHHKIAAEITAQADMCHRICHGLADYHSLPFFGNMFDLYWCQESFVHAADKSRIMKEAYRVLAPGGKIIFSDQTTNRDACLPEERDQIARRHGVADLCDADDFSEFLRGAGFKIQNVEDWSVHMTRHFEKLVARMESQWCELAQSIDETVLQTNYENWLMAAQYAQQGKIGWHCFLARKP